MKNIFINGLLGLSIMLLSCTGVSAKTYRLGVITPPPHQWTLTAKKFAEKLKLQSHDDFEIAVFPSGQLGNEAQMLQQLQSGALDFAFLAAGEIANRRENFASLFAPYLVKDPDAASKLLKGPTATAMLEDLRSIGLVGLGYGMAGMRQIVVREKVDSIAALKGSKIRTMPVAPEHDFWIKIGAAPTPIPLPGLYDAFTNGQVDGMQIDFELTWKMRYVDKAGTVIQSNHMMLPMIAVASAKVWQNFSATQKTMIQQLISGQLDKLIASYQSIDSVFLDKITESGAHVIRVDRSFFGSAVDAWYEDWRKRAPSLIALEKEAAGL